MKEIISKFNEGGPIFTVIIFILFFVIIGLFVKALLDKEYSKKWRSLMASFGWFALAWGYLGRTFGLIMAFDNIAAAGDITPSLMAGGLKMALIGPLMGIVAFVMARIGIIIIVFLTKKQVIEAED